MLKSIAMSPHECIVPTTMGLQELITPVTVRLLRCSNACDLEYQTNLLISWQASCPLTTVLLGRKDHNLFYELPTSTR